MLEIMRFISYSRSLRVIYIVIIILLIFTVVYLSTVSNLLFSLFNPGGNESARSSKFACNCAKGVIGDIGKNEATEIIQKLRSELRQKNQIIKELKDLIRSNRIPDRESSDKQKLKRKAKDSAYENPVYLKKTEQKIKETLEKFPQFPMWGFDNKFLYESLPFRLKTKINMNTSVTKGMVEIIKLHKKEVCSYLKQHKSSKKCDIVYGGISLDLVKGLDLIFIVRERKNKFLKITSNNKFESLTEIRKSEIVLQKEIYIITIISDLIPESRIQKFLTSLQDVNVSNLQITLILTVYHGEKEEKYYTRLIKNVWRQKNRIKIKVSYQGGKFERGSSRHFGVSQIVKKDALILFVDIDVTFTADFLERCQACTKKGKSLYFPIVFSFYNPAFLIRKAPKKKMPLSQHFGIWRGAGYGNLCVYKSDYSDIGGFNTNITGWGSEDNDLYHRFLTNSSLQVVRFPDSGIFHHWHPKHCRSEFVSKDRYQACLSTNINYDASAEQLATKLSSCMNKNKPVHKGK